MATFQSLEKVDAVQVDRIQKHTVNEGELVLDPTFVSQNVIRPGSWLVGPVGRAPDRVLSNAAFRSAYEPDDVSWEDFDGTDVPVDSDEE